MNRRFRPIKDTVALILIVVFLVFVIYFFKDRDLFDGIAAIITYLIITDILGSE